MTKFGRYSRGPGLFSDVLGTRLRCFGDGWVPTIHSMLVMPGTCTSIQIHSQVLMGVFVTGLQGISRKWEIYYKYLWIY